MIRFGWLPLFDDSNCSFARIRKVTSQGSLQTTAEKKKFDSKMDAPKLFILLFTVLALSISQIAAGPGGFIHITNKTPHVLVR